MFLDWLLVLNMSAVRNNLILSYITTILCYVQNMLFKRGPLKYLEMKCHNVILFLILTAKRDWDKHDNQQLLNPGDEYALYTSPFCTFNIFH